MDNIGKIKKIKNNKRNRKGFTLIEVIFYISMLSVFILIISTFWQGLIDVQEKSRAMNAVHSESQFIMSKILQVIRDSNEITSPTYGLSSSSISLERKDINDNPTTIELNGNNIRISEGSIPFSNLNSSRVSISNLQFSNNAKSDSSGLINIQFTISYVNPENRSNLNYSQVFYGSASIK